MDNPALICKDFLADALPPFGPPGEEMSEKKKTRAQQVASSLLFLSMLPLMSCADNEGDNPYALWDVYEHERKLYHFQYLTPPWTFISDLEEINRQVIAINPRLERIDYRTERESLHARIKVVVEIQNWWDPRTVAQTDMAHYRDEALEFRGPETFKSARGFSGFKTRATFPGNRRVVSIYQGLENRGTVVLRAAANEFLETDDMLLLMKSLEPEPVSNR
jgi:hypothetical protein